MSQRRETEHIEKELADARTKAKEHFGAGIGLGLVSVGAAAIGAVCPLCVVAVPALVGSGVYHRYKQRCMERELDDVPESAPEGSASAADGNV